MGLDYDVSEELQLSALSDGPHWDIINHHHIR
jgi:hypothetical protein